MGFLLATAVAIGIAVLLVLRWARTYPQALLLMMPLAYEMVTVNASVFFLDHHEVFISETGTTSFESNAALRLLFFNALIVAGVGMGFGAWSTLFGRLGTTVTPPMLDRCRGVLWLMVFIMGISLANVLLSLDVPYPGSGFDRQSFWEHRIRFPIIRDLFGVLLAFVPFVGAAVELYGRRLGNRRLMTCARVVLVLYFLYLVIGGQVFHGLIFPVTIVAALLFADKVHSGAKVLLTSRLPVLIAGGGALVVTTYLSFENRGITQNFASAWDAIVYRVLVLQGSTYWQCDLLWGQNGTTGSLQTLIHGREFLIRTIMPARLAEDYLGAGVNLQGALPGTSLLSVGLWPTVLVCIGYGVLMGFITSLVYSMVVKGRVFLLLPASYLWLWTITVYSRASLEQIVDFKYLLFALVVAGASLAWLPDRQRKTRSQADRGPTRGSPDITLPN